MSNLTKRPIIQKGVRHKKAPIRFEDEDHLKWIRTLPCLLCGGTAEVHHLLRVPTNERGGAMKTGDRWAVPLCHEHHMLLHTWGDEIAFMSANKIYGPAIAALLYQLTGDTDAALRSIGEMR